MHPRRSLRRLTRCSLAAVLLAGVACSPPPEDPRPSFLLVVFDTLRKDAVSAFGAVDGTTPNLDALARDGLAYPLAFAPSPWTLPSHATLFTGLPVDRHGVGIGGQLSLGPDPVTLAERLHAAGYQTAGFSENPLVGADFDLDQGFEHYAHETIQQKVDAYRGKPTAGFDLVGEVARWLETRAADRPFFVFVNLFDPHDPYTVREVNDFLPAGVATRDAKRLQSYSEGGAGIAERVGICDRIPSHDELAILKGLYLGDVAAADAKLAEIRELLAGASRSRGLVTIATSDHGEHLGEHRLLGHEFSVRNVALNVPLVVHGLPDVAPAVVDAVVELADLAPSILRWAGVERPEDLPGRPLPLSPEKPGVERSIVGLYTDALLAPDADTLPGGAALVGDTGADDARRKGCGPEDGVFGTTVSLARYPNKLIWFENNPSQLYDLSWDPHERSDQAAFQPELVAELEGELAEIRRRFARDGDPPAAAPSAEAAEALRGLGYVD